jgi:catechol 2,3-dioxygenase-like lactoylglutathione lyase family enzyme
MISRRLSTIAVAAFSIAIGAAAVAADTAAARAAAIPHTIGAAKLIVSDLPATQKFFESMFGMKEVAHYQADGVYDEPIMGFDSGARLALFQPKAEAPLPKSRYAVVAIYTSEFDAVLARIQEIGLGFRDVKSGTPDQRIIVAKDPAGNAVEIISR